MNKHRKCLSDGIIIQSTFQNNKKCVYGMKFATYLYVCDNWGVSFRKAYKLELSWRKRSKENIWKKTVKVNNLKYYKTKNLYCLELSAL
jgi:hypothetical protein